jgi:NADH-quinone oxidoreductase subunit N
MAPTPMQLLAVGPGCSSASRSRSRPCRSTCGRPTPYEGRAAGGHRVHVHRREGGAFAAFVRVFLSAFEPLRGSWSEVLWVVAAATMIVGTVVGVAQTNVKRMLAYSSIAHGGYLLVALVAANGRRQGLGAVLPADLCRSTNIGAFGVITLLDNLDQPNDEVATTPGCGTITRRSRR